ncbi:MAG: hypothetical protein QNK05_24285 [Myxococcota bacterium]|nr:hypothetical protein [Myxococcota bacterium]
MASGSGGGKGLLVVAVLLIAGVAGGVNYWRNYQAELQEAGERPYKGYADEELAALIEAYGSESDARRGRHQQLAGRRTEGVAREAHISDHLEGYERARRQGEAVRESAAATAQVTSVLRELEREQALRGSAGAGLEVHIRRLTTL